MCYNVYMNNKGFSLKELIIFTALLLVVIVLGVVLLNGERARVRDAKRIADMTQVRYGFEILFNEKNSYTEASQGCSREGELVSSCSLSGYLSNISKIKDPGKNSYTITKIPDSENFEVTFYLEKSYDSLVSGKHTLSANGIQ